jgi:hypothetical protein
MFGQDVGRPERPNFRPRKARNPLIRFGLASWYVSRLLIYVVSPTSDLYREYHRFIYHLNWLVISKVSPNNFPMDG